jgi:hypothetical protein
MMLGGSGEVSCSGCEVTQAVNKTTVTRRAGEFLIAFSFYSRGEAPHF